MKKSVFYSLAIIFVAIFAFSCQKTAKNTFVAKPVVHQDWTRTSVIYEVNVRQYTKEGTFKAFENYLPQLKDLGVDVLWFMPIHPISELNRKGTLGSYYAVKDYKGINPEFGTAADFKSLVDKAHEMGFKVIIDWVANHTGCDNVWLANHKDWYVLDSVGNPVSPHDWTDTYKLNYNNGSLRAAMAEAMKYWVTDYDIDGFRCDVASEVPTMFWDSVRTVLDSIKPMFMLAESEKPELLANAFDADYSWNLLSLMNNIAQNDSSVQTIRNYLINNDSILPNDAYKMNFITNHDENSWNGTEYERYKDGAQAFAVLTYTLPGMPLIYTGQEIGLKKRLEFFEKDPIPSWTKNNTFTFYKKLNDLKHTHPALKAGEQGGEIKMYNHIGAANNILIFSRFKEGKEIIVALNLSDKKHDVYSNDVFPKEEFTEYFTGKKSKISFPIKLGPWEYRVWVR